MKLMSNLKPVLLFLMLCSIVIILSIVASHYFLHTTQSVQAFQAWLITNHYALLLWRMLIITVIFFIWLYYIRARANKKHWSQLNIRMAINCRYYIVLILLIIDLLLHL